MDDLIQVPQHEGVAESGESYSCMDCEWIGDISECEFDSEYDEFSGRETQYPICPDCGGGLDC